MVPTAGSSDIPSSMVRVTDAEAQCISSFGNEFVQQVHFALIGAFLWVHEKVKAVKFSEVQPNWKDMYLERLGRRCRSLDFDCRLSLDLDLHRSQG